MSSPAKSGRSMRRRLLVVDDDLISVFSLRRFFALVGYDVDCAAGQSEGLRLLDRNGYDAIITARHLLPERRSEGLALAERARRRNPGACVVMLTAGGGPDDDGGIPGVDIVHPKPLDLAALMNGIGRVLQGDAAACVPRPTAALPVRSEGA